MGSRAKSDPPNHLIWPANGFRKCVSNYNVRQKFNFYLILFESLATRKKFWPFNKYI